MDALGQSIKDTECSGSQKRERYTRVQVAKNSERYYGLHSSQKPNFNLTADESVTQMN